MMVVISFSTYVEADQPDGAGHDESTDAFFEELAMCSERLLDTYMESGDLAG